jgi:hypothetical protein
MAETQQDLNSEQEEESNPQPQNDEESQEFIEDVPLVEDSWTYEDEEHNASSEGALSGEFTAPYQPSGAMPLVDSSSSQSGQMQQSRIFPRAHRKKSKVGLVAMVAVVVFIVLLSSVMLIGVFAKPQMPIAQQANGHPQLNASTQQTMHPKVVQSPAPAHLSPAATRPTTTPTTVATPPQQQANGVPSAQLLQQLGWTTAGLSTADAIQADRTAITFTDREEGLVFNEPGTRTAAEFLLTSAGKNRFAQNDVRLSSDALWNSVTNPARQLIQLAVNEQPTLVKQLAQGQNQFAWVDVQFQLWQSQIDPQNRAQRIGGLEVNPATGAPRMHHMVILLLQVAPGSLGANAPMGGTGWLVSNYMLDPTAGTLPPIVAPA